MEFEPADFTVRIGEAYRRIQADIRRTPLAYSEPLSRETGARVFVKWECDQVTGSFKLRGALNKLRSLSEEEKALGVVSASTGNHGLAMGQASKLVGVGLKLFLPATVSEVKKKKIEAMGIDIELHGSSCDKTEAFAREWAVRTGRIFVSPYNDWDIVLGAGTVGLEVAEDLARFDDVLVPVGGGGLIAGMAGYLQTARPEARLVGIEPETSAFMAASLAAGRLVEIAEKETVADAVAGGIEPGSITFPLCRDLLDFIECVPESLIARAMGLVFRHHGKMIEGAGALPLAALLHSPQKWRDRTVVAVVSGGNIAPQRFRTVTGQ